MNTKREQPADVSSGAHTPKKPLTPTQTLAAAELLKERPAVIEGTRVIPNAAARANYYNRVTETMRRLRVADHNVNAFCDLAGVPD